MTREDKTKFCWALFISFLVITSSIEIFLKGSGWLSLSAGIAGLMLGVYQCFYCFTAFKKLDVEKYMQQTFHIFFCAYLLCSLGALNREFPFSGLVNMVLPLLLLLFFVYNHEFMEWAKNNNQ